MNWEEIIQENVLDTKGRVSCSKINYLKKNSPDIYKKIFNDTSFLDNIQPVLRQRLYHLYNNIYYIPSCEVCNNKVNFKDIIKGYKSYCSLTCRNIGTREQRENTCLKKYGYKTPLGNVEQKKAACFEKYGVSNYSKTKEFKNLISQKRKSETEEQKEIRFSKQRDTFLEKYGVSWYSKSEEYIEKGRNTCLEKYGVKHQSQCPEIYEKMPGFKNSWHDYILPSGTQIKLQGYEPQALDMLLKIYKEEDILYKKTDVPEIWYVGEDNKKHRYYPDFYIPKDNLVIEVKSEYTYNYDLNKNLLKEEATKKSGYNFELVI